MLLGAWSLILVSLACVRAMGWLTELIETCWGKVMLKTLGLEVAGRAGRDVRLAVDVIANAFASTEAR